MLTNLLNEYVHIISDGMFNLSCSYMRKIKEASWYKKKAVYLKTSFSFCLKTAENMERLEKEVMHSFHSGKYVGWQNLIQNLSNSLHEAFFASLTSKMELGAN